MSNNSNCPYYITPGNIAKYSANRGAWYEVEDDKFKRWLEDPKFPKVHQNQPSVNYNQPTNTPKPSSSPKPTAKRPLETYVELTDWKKTNSKLEEEIKRLDIRVLDIEFKYCYLRDMLWKHIKQDHNLNREEIPEDVQEEEEGEITNK